MILLKYYVKLRFNAYIYLKNKYGQNINMENWQKPIKRKQKTKATTTKTAFYILYINHVNMQGGAPSPVIINYPKKMLKIVKGKDRGDPTKCTSCKTPGYNLAMCSQSYRSFLIFT